MTAMDEFLLYLGEIELDYSFGCLFDLDFLSDLRSSYYKLYCVDNDFDLIEGIYAKYQATIDDVMWLSYFDKCRIELCMNPKYTERCLLSPAFAGVYFNMLMRLSDVSQNHVQAFIQNISFPESTSELEWYAGLFNMEQILGVWDRNDPGLCVNSGWTVPRWAKEDDIVLFFHAKTAKSKISRLRSELDEDGFAYYDSKEYWFLRNSLVRARSIYDMYGGKLFAIGRVAGKPYLDHDMTDGLHWKSNIYAAIDSIFLLDKPIDISEFSNRVSISRCSSITPLFGSDFDYIQSLVLKNNKHVMSYFSYAISQPVFLTKMDDTNFLSVAGECRYQFFLEEQFRVYYVDYLLKLLGSHKTVYKECRCCKRDGSYGFVDNVIRMRDTYLPVEVKLNKDIEVNLFAQLDKYIDVDTCVLNNKLSVDGGCLLSCVLLIDTYGIYLYDGFGLDLLCDLSTLRTVSDVISFSHALQSYFM